MQWNWKTTHEWCYWPSPHLFTSLENDCDEHDDNENKNKQCETRCRNLRKLNSKSLQQQQQLSRAELLRVWEWAASHTNTLYLVLAFCVPKYIVGARERRKVKRMHCCWMPTTTVGSNDRYELRQKMPRDAKRKEQKRKKRKCPEDEFSALMKVIHIRFGFPPKSHRMSFTFLFFSSSAHTNRLLVDTLRKKKKPTPAGMSIYEFLEIFSFFFGAENDSSFSRRRCDTGLLFRCCSVYMVVWCVETEHFFMNTIYVILINGLLMCANRHSDEFLRISIVVLGGAVSAHRWMEIVWPKNMWNETKCRGQ